MSFKYDIDIEKDEKYWIQVLTLFFPSLTLLLFFFLLNCQKKKKKLRGGGCSRAM